MSRAADRAEAALAAAAREAATRAYAPYSGFNVGAAVLCEDGRIFSAANVENASYGLSLCAEANALAAAASAGARRITMLAVIAYPAADPAAAVATPPCGRCRQMIAEFATPETPVLVLAPDGAPQRHTLADLLPHPFGPAQMPQASRKDAIS